MRIVDFTNVVSRVWEGGGGGLNEYLFSMSLNMLLSPVFFGNIQQDLIMMNTEKISNDTKKNS